MPLSRGNLTDSALLGHVSLTNRMAYRGPGPLTQNRDEAAPYRPIEAYIHVPAIWIEERLPRQSDIVWPRMLDVVLRRRLAAGFDVTVRREGFIAFDFTGTDLDYGSLDMERVSMIEHPAHFARMRARAEALTFHAACLLQARAEATGAHGFRASPVTSPRMIHFDQGMTNPACYDRTMWLCIAQRENGELRDHLAQALPAWTDAAPEWISITTLTRSFDIFDQRYDLGRSGTMRAVGMLLQATEHLERDELPQAFAVAWMVIEHFLARKWDEHVQAYKQGLGSPELTAYVRGMRRPRHSVYDKLVGLVLAEPGVWEYARALQLRDLRNDLVHDLAPITGPEAADGVNLGVRLLHIVEGMDLRIGGGYGYAL